MSIINYKKRNIMKKNIALFVSLSIFLSLSAQAMEYPEKEGKQEVSQLADSSQGRSIVLMDSYGNMFKLAQQAALQSPMLAALMYMSSDIAHQTRFSSKVLSIIVSLLELQVTQQEPYTQSLLQDIHANIIQPAQLSEQEQEELIDAADMYELELFPAYFADRLYKRYQGNVNAIDAIMETYDNQPGFQKKVARYLFLLHDIKLDDIDWEISVQDAIDYHKVQREKYVTGDFLILNDLHISDLTGLNNIENKGNISQIMLGNNKLTHIDANVFGEFENLRFINLENNNIAFIDAAAFQGIYMLPAIDLKGNNITHFNPDIFKDIPFLESVDLRGNPIPKEDIARSFK